MLKLFRQLTLNNWMPGISNKRMWYSADKNTRKTLLYPMILKLHEKVKPQLD